MGSPRGLAAIPTVFLAAAFAFVGAKGVSGQTIQPPDQVHVYAVSQTSLKVLWLPSSNETFEVFRDATSVGTTTAPSFVDSGLLPGTVHSYTVVAHEGTITSQPSSPRFGTTQTSDGSFVMDGYPDFDTYRIEFGGCGCGETVDLGIWAALRGQTLYVAMPTIPPGGQYDYFLMVSDTTGFPSNAPWAKAGQIDVPAGKPFIGAESTNSYVSWFNAPASAQVIRSADPAGVIEGTLNLIDTFGYIPQHIYIAVLAYQTQDGGHLVAQSPAGNNDDFVAPNEIRGPLVDALRDEDQDGFFDRIDPNHGWRISSITQNADGTFNITAPAGPVFDNVPYLLIGNQSPSGSYYYYAYAPVDDSGVVSVRDPTPPNGTPRFYKMMIQITQ